VNLEVDPLARYAERMISLMSPALSGKRTRIRSPMLLRPRSTPGFGSATPIASTAQIIEEIGRGNLVVLVDDEDRENEGDLVFAADFVTPEKSISGQVRARLICMPVTEEHARRLRLTPMSQDNRSVHGTNFTVSIEAAEGVTRESRRPIGRTRSGSRHGPTRNPSRSCSRVTYFRWWPDPAAC